MATAGANKDVCNLVQGGTLKLKHEANPYPWYTDLAVLSQDKIMVVDCKAKNVRFHSLQDGRQLALYILEFCPCDICICSIDNNETQISVSLASGQIEILSVKCTDQTPNIRRMKTLNVQTYFDCCLGLKYLNKKLVVSGVKQDNLCWGIVSITDGLVETVYNICKCGEHGASFLSTNNKDMVYISCWAGDKYPDIAGVYGYRNSRQEFLYQHKDLKDPRGVTVDTRGHVFVCNWKPPCIHQLTESGQPLAIHRQRIPPSSSFYAIHWSQQHGLLYITSYKSNVITLYGVDYSNHEDPIIPAEVLKMDTRSLHMYKEALRTGKEKVYNIRLMVVGQYGVGKTTLTKRLLGKDVNISERKSTEGINVHIECSKVSLASGEWTVQEKNLEQDYRLQRLAKVLIEKQSLRARVGDQKEVVIPPQGERTSDSNASVTDEEQIMSPPQGGRTPDSNTNVADKEQVIICPQGDTTPECNAFVADKEQVEIDPMREMIKLLHENADKLKQDTGKTAPLTIWDFAGQYVFYTTHQTFLTRRAIYLLVSDVSGHVTDSVDDECFFDSEGMTERKVHELIDVWLNSIHSCASSPEASTPPVILVGTHVDKITKLPAKEIELEPHMPFETEEFELPTISTPAAANKELWGWAWVWTRLKNFFKPRKTEGTVEATTVSSMTGAHALPAVDQPKTKWNWKFWQWKEEERVDADTEKRYRYELCEKYFREIRSHLGNKPTRFHLVDEDFAIDNTIVDSKLEDLKRKILEVASHQPYWGEEKPARWLPLEQELMKLKATGIKVIPLSLLEGLNQAGAVQIATDELLLFLRFQHDIGTIIYFSMEVLKEKIVLDPQWMIDALKSLITAREFVLKSALAVADKWFEFEQKGKLSSELIDVIWTEENNPDLHDNKEHILLLMECLNIIAKPRCYSEDMSEIKVKNYFLAPCMLRETTPREVIFPEPQPNMESSSVLCYIFIGKYLPPPIFHRLLATCVAHWPIAQKKSENLIFCGCCIFDLDIHHRLTMFFKDYIIFARVTRMGTTEKTPSSKLCVEVREFIDMTLSNVIVYLGQSLQFELYIQCPKSDGYSIDCLIPVADLQRNLDVPCHFHDNSHVIRSHDVLKFWFQEEEHSDNGSHQELRKFFAQGPSESKSCPTHILDTEQEAVMPTQEASRSKETEGLGSSDRDLLESVYEGAVTDQGASAIGLQESVDGSSPRSSSAERGLLYQELEHSVLVQKATLSTFEEQKVRIPKNPRCGRIIRMSVENMTRCTGMEIEKGSFGIVYKANMPEEDECKFAIKEINVTDELKLKSYEKEIHYGWILHPFINPIIACADNLRSESAERVSYLMYPYMENGNLRRNIDLENAGKNLCTKGQESNSQIWTRCIYQIAHAVDYLHKPVNKSFRGPIFHQDLTSNNIFLDGNFNVKIGDFGIAVEAKQNASAATMTRVQGTHGYHPRKQYNESYDIFSVGVVMLEILTGEDAKLKGKTEYLSEKYGCKGGKEDLIDDLDDRARKNKAAEWIKRNRRDDLAKLSLEAVNQDETERKEVNLIQKLDEMRLNPNERYLWPTKPDRCVSCYINRPAKLPLKGKDCAASKSPCQPFCIHCLMNNHINPLKCPQHGKTRPPLGDHVYGVFVAGNNVKDLQQFLNGEGNSQNTEDVAQTFIKDAEKVVKILTAKHPFVLGTSVEYLKIVKPNNPGTEEDMETSIKDAFEKMNSTIREALRENNQNPEKDRLPNSLFIFYFSGHCSEEKGLYLGNAEETLKASTTEGEKETQKATTKWIKEMLHEKLGVDHVLVILDCCHAGSQNFTDSRGLNVATASANKRKKVSILQLSSCDISETSTLKCQVEGSVFTHFLCLGLQGMKLRGGKLICCGECEKHRKNRKDMTFELPCVKYHHDCISNHAVTYSSLREFIQGHFDLLRADNTSSSGTMTPVHNAQGEKKVFLVYYNPYKSHISIHLKGSIPLHRYSLSSHPESMDKLRKDIISYTLSGKRDMSCDVLTFHQSYGQESYHLIAIHLMYGKDKDEELSSVDSIEKAWLCSLELEARVREDVKALSNGPVKLGNIRKSMVADSEKSLNSEILNINQDYIEIAVKSILEAEKQLKEIKQSSSEQHEQYITLIQEVLKTTRSIRNESSLLEKINENVLRFYLYNEFSVLKVL